MCACSVALAGVLMGWGCCGSAWGVLWWRSMNAMWRVPMGVSWPLSLQKYVDAVQPSGQAPKVHVQTPSGVCAAKLPGLAASTSCRPWFAGGFSYKNAIAVDMYPWRRGALSLVRIGPACDGQASLRE